MDALEEAASRRKRPDIVVDEASMTSLRAATASTSSRPPKRHLVQTDPSSYEPSTTTTKGASFRRSQLKPKNRFDFDPSSTSTSKPSKVKKRRNERVNMELQQTMKSRQEEEHARLQLERKSNIYNQLVDGKLTLNEDQLNLYSVDFTSKPTSSTPPPPPSNELPTSFEGRAAATKSDVPRLGDPIQEEEDWVTYTDELGRQRLERVDVLEERGFKPSLDEFDDEGNPTWTSNNSLLDFDPQQHGGFSQTQSGQHISTIDESSVTYGDQYSFPVYEPLLPPPQVVENPIASTSLHFDSTIEARTRNAMFYKLPSTGGVDRRHALDQLKQSSKETDRARQEFKDQDDKSVGEKVKEERIKLLQAKRSETLKKRSGK